MPLVSVIVPIYNAEAYLDQCLQSLVFQDLENIEILCINDCSHDGSESIIDNYAQSDTRIKKINLDRNQGLSVVLNTGISYAKGSYVCSVDADDWIEKHMIRRLYSTAHANDLDVVICGRKDIDHQNCLLTKRRLSNPGFYRLPARHGEALRISGHSFWAKLWKRELLIHHEICFPPGLYYQDLATVPRLLFKATKIQVLADDLYHYRIRRGSTSLSISDKHILDYIRVFDILYDFFEISGVSQLYSSDLKSAFISNIAWHAENVSNSNLEVGVRRKYLRLLSIVANGYKAYGSCATVINSPRDLLRCISA